MTTRNARVVFIPLVDDGTIAENGEMYINESQETLYWKDFNGSIHRLTGGGTGGGGGSGGTGNFDDLYVSSTLQVDGVALFGSEVNFNLVKLYGVRDPQADDEVVNLRTLNDKIQAYTASLASLNPVLLGSNKALYSETISQWASTTNLTVAQDLTTTTPFSGTSARVNFTSQTTWHKTIYERCTPIAIGAGGSVVFSGYGSMTNGLKCIRVRLFDSSNQTLLGEVVINMDTWTKVSGSLTPLFQTTTIAGWRRFSVKYTTVSAVSVTARVELCRNDGSTSGSPETTTLYMNVGGWQFESNTQITDYSKTTNYENFGRYSVYVPGSIHKKGIRPIIEVERLVAPGQYSKVETGYMIESSNGNIEIQYPEEANLVNGRVKVK